MVVWVLERSEFPVVLFIVTGVGRPSLCISYVLVLSSSDPSNRSADSPPVTSSEFLQESSVRASPEATRATMRVGAMPCSDVFSC